LVGLIVRRGQQRLVEGIGCIECTHRYLQSSL
jgi:hypothetical protein